MVKRAKMQSALPHKHIKDIKFFYQKRAAVENFKICRQNCCPKVMKSFYIPQMFYGFLRKWFLGKWYKFMLKGGCMRFEVGHISCNLILYIVKTLKN